ncbi:Forkhead box protein F2 [Serendipita sp. 401]|nr:Forkhead box protein F2 [Serendipita sp. 401]
MDVEPSDPLASTGSEHAASSNQHHMEGTPVANQDVKQEGDPVEISSPGDTPPTPTVSTPQMLQSQGEPRGGPETEEGAEHERDSLEGSVSPPQSDSELASLQDSYPIGLNPLFATTPAAIETPAIAPPDTPMEHAVSTPRPLLLTTASTPGRHTSEPPGAPRLQFPGHATRSSLSPSPEGKPYSQLAQELAPPQTAESVASSFSRNAAAARRTTRGSLAAAAAAASVPEQVRQTSLQLETTRKPGSVRVSADAWLEPDDPNWIMPPPQLGVSLAQISPPGSTVLTWMRLTRHPIIWDGKTDAGGKSGRNLVLIGYAAGKVSVNGKLPAKGEEDPTSEGLHLLMDCDPDKKPSYSYSLITRFAILGSPYKSLSLSEIYMILEAKFPWFAKEEMKWRDSIRYNLSSNNWFVKMKRALHQPGVGNLWKVDEQSIGGPKRPRKGRTKPWTEADEEEDEISGDEPTPNSDTRIISANSNGSMMLTFDSKRRASSENRQTGRGSSTSSAASLSPPGDGMDVSDRYADARDSTFVRAGMNAFHATKAAKESASKKTPIPPWMINDHEQDMEEGIGSGRDDDDDYDDDEFGGEDETYLYDREVEGPHEAHEDRMRGDNFSDEDVEMSEQGRKRSLPTSALSKRPSSKNPPTASSDNDDPFAKWDGKTLKRKPSITIGEDFLRGEVDVPAVPIKAPGYDNLMRDGRTDVRKSISTAISSPIDVRASLNSATLWNSQLSSKPPGAGIFPSLNSLENPRSMTAAKRDMMAPKPEYGNEAETSARPTSPWKPAPDSRKRNFASISPTRVSTDTRKQKLRKVQDEISQRRQRGNGESPFSVARSSTVGAFESTARPLVGNKAMPPPPNPIGQSSSFTFSTSTVQRNFAMSPANNTSDATQPAPSTSSVFGKPSFVGSSKGLFSFVSTKTHKGSNADPMRDPRRDPTRLRSESRGRGELSSSSEDDVGSRKEPNRSRDRRESTRMETSDDDRRVGRPPGLGRILGTGSDLWTNPNSTPMNMFHQMNTKSALSPLSIAVPTSSSRHERGPSSGSNIQSPVSPSQQSPNSISPTLSQSPRLPSISSLLHQQVPPGEHDSLPPIQNIPSRPSSVSHVSPPPLDHQNFPSPAIAALYYNSP